MKKILIKNGNVIFENRIERADILVENDKIIKIGSIEKECESIDAKGLYVCPGFIDIHTHGGNGFDYMAGTLEAFVAAITLHLQHGATSIVPTTVAADTEYTIEFLHRFDQLKNDAKIPVVY